MKREIIITSDGSTTIHLPDWNEQYHSKHGAIQEAYHVFIKNGLYPICQSERSEESNSKDKISILEIGFGTGLNAFITFLEAKKKQLNINYIGVEAYPVKEEEINQLNYVDQLNAEQYKSIFENMHSVSWENSHQISNNFSITKQEQFFHEINAIDEYHLIYFDAFGARVQPELWTEEIFKIMYKALKANGVLVTYAAKGSVRRALQNVGFFVERLPGPPGKREMLRATKIVK